MLKLFRFYAWLYRCGVPVLPKLLCIVNRIVFAVVLPPSVKVGRNVKFAYHGLATVMHPDVVIGDDVYIGAQVVLGGRGGEKGVPTIQDGVILGVGACVLGPVTIGKGATVAASALVIHDVAPGQTVAGVPAKPIRASGKQGEIPG